MRKARITITGEIELDPENHDEGATPQEMLKEDIEQCQGDPQGYIDSFDNIQVTGELLPEAKETQAEEHGPEEQGSGA